MFITCLKLVDIFFPVLYYISMTDDQFSQFCELISQGKSIPKACETIHIAHEAPYEYRQKMGEIAEVKYARAREEYLDKQLTKRESIIEKYKAEILANPQCGNALASMCREECRQIEWELAKRAPRKWGDKIAIEGSMECHTVRLPAKRQECK
jgi:glycerol-3-phosphate O-acyltransferase